MGQRIWRAEAGRTGKFSPRPREMHVHFALSPPPTRIARLDQIRTAL
jgi:hypothetical protein